MANGVHRAKNWKTNDCNRVEIGMTLTVESVPSITSARPRILVIEDHAPTRMAITNLIRQAGAEVVAARDCDEGLSYLLTRHFDVLLTDVRARMSEGNQLLQDCAALPESRRPSRVILFSSAAGDGALIGAMRGDRTRAFSLDALLDMFDGRPN
jgi:CheY-like chemotaxis protein